MYEIGSNDSFCNGVLFGLSALIRNGLTQEGPAFCISIATDDKEKDGLETENYSLHYLPEIDEVNYVTPSPYNKNLLIPTAERALAECFKYFDSFDPIPFEDWIILASVNDYLYYSGGTKEKLKEVCDFYKVTDEVFDSWMADTRQYEIIYSS